MIFRRLRGTDSVLSFDLRTLPRGTKHLRELTKLQQSGTDAYVLFVIQMQDVLSLEANRRTDPAFADALLAAHAAGVGVHAVDCLVTPDSVTARNPVPVRFV